MPAFTTRPEILGTFGVVTTTHWLATATGMAVLEKGGNAFDAAVATAFALQAVEPHLCGPGGDAPLLFAPASDKKVRVICGQGPAPAAASMATYRALGINVIPGNGLLPAVVPGAFDAYMTMLRDWGSMTLGEALSPAIDFLKNGCPLVPKVCDTIASVQDMFRTHWKSSAAVFLPGGAVPTPGIVFRNPKLAETYVRIVREAESAGGERVRQIEAARACWYKGFVAEAIDRFCRTEAVMDSSGTPHTGYLTGDDMAKWQATYEPPTTYDYNGYTLCKTQPWGQGPVALQILALLKGFELGKLKGSNDPEFIHLIVEATKLAFADREKFYADPDFVKVPMDRLLSDAYNARRRALIGEHASMEFRPGEIEGFGGRVILREKQDRSDLVKQGIGEPTLKKLAPANMGDGREARGDTVHLDIIDRHGNMVSATPSGGWLQSSPVIPELGFCLPTRGQMFWLEDGVLSNLAPNKRPRSTLSPSLALRDGEPYMVFGTPGGDQQDQWPLHTFLRHVHYGMNLQEAIDTPGFHTEHFPDSFYPREWNPGYVAMEGRYPKAAIDDMKRRGHKVDVVDDWCESRVTAAAKDGPLLKAAANPRFMQGYAIGR
ncbi:MAG: gamma-glutamyltransferase family protein [Proteobacteria bacterium]|nr:gamma-glutamyltransferase family protein [Pseudomonadota bacterium]